MYAATSGLIAVSLSIAVFAGPLAGMTERAGVDLLERASYRAAVLGEGP
jgi:multicomponent Na+:H+ antiporter subunit D